MFLNIDGTFIIQLINFAIFFAILSVVFLRPVGNAIAKRREYINSIRSDYERYQSEANALRAQAEGIRAAARREAEQIVAKERADASNEAAEIAGSYAARVSSTVEEAHRTVAGELEGARVNEAQQVRELADTMLRITVAEAAP